MEPTTQQQPRKSNMPRFGQQAELAKVTADSLSDGWQSRTFMEALDEVGRELGVRERLYAKWCLEGKHSETEAKDRMQRMIKAASILQAICDDPGLQATVETQLEAPTVPKVQKEPF